MESVKGASDIFSPVSGTIVEANKDLGKWKKLKFLGAQGPSS